LSVEKPEDFLEECLDLVLLIFKPELVNKINHFDRRIILSLSRSAKSASAIAEETGMNRKTVTIRLRKLRKLDVVTYTPSKNTRYALSDSFLKNRAKAARLLLERKGTINTQNMHV
jgi:DNA-binding MarR family transcriptional regulator